jgi:regulator of sigma E protease
LECSPGDSLRLRHLTLTVEHAGQMDTLNILMTKEFKIGFMPLLSEVKSVHEDYGFFESFPAGVSYGWNVLGGYVSDLKYLFTKQGAKSVGGFGSIGSIFPDKWDWHRFWLMTAFLSIILGFMNILPIPALDGGHVLFLLFEVVTGRKPNDKFLEYAQMVGMALLFLLMIWANLNDVIRFLF